MSDGVVDASSALAVLKGESGAALVFGWLASGRGFLSTVNATEILTRLSDDGMTMLHAAAALDQLKLILVPFTENQAAQAASLRASTKRAGLSLRDRACLALAIELQLPVLTTDRAWAQLDLPVAVILTR